jgi:hypothetical protein
MCCSVHVFLSFQYGKHPSCLVSLSAESFVCTLVLFSTSAQRTNEPCVTESGDAAPLSPKKTGTARTAGFSSHKLSGLKRISALVLQLKEIFINFP